MSKPVCSIALVLFAFAMSAFAMSTGGCSKNSSQAGKEAPPVKNSKLDKYQTEFQMPVERMDAPATVKFTDKLVIKLHGFIGGDSSTRFDRMEMVVSNSKLELKAFGIHDKSPDKGFGQAEVRWGGREFTKNGPHHGPVQVIYHQPDGTTLEKTVEVTMR